MLKSIVILPLMSYLCVLHIVRAFANKQLEKKVVCGILRISTNGVKKADKGCTTNTNVDE